MHSKTTTYCLTKAPVYSSNLVTFICSHHITNLYEMRGYSTKPKFPPMPCLPKKLVIDRDEGYDSF